MSMFTEAVQYDRYMQYDTPDEPVECCRKCGQRLRDDEGWTCVECLEVSHE